MLPFQVVRIVIPGQNMLLYMTKGTLHYAIKSKIFKSGDYPRLSSQAQWNLKCHCKREAGRLEKEKIKE